MTVFNTSLVFLVVSQIVEMNHPDNDFMERKTCRDGHVLNWTGDEDKAINGYFGVHCCTHGF